MECKSDEENQACDALLLMGAAERKDQPEENGSESDDPSVEGEELQCETSQRGGKRKRVLCEDIRECFNMPLTRAAEQLGIGTTTLKRICREYGIARWPYREVSFLSSSS